jgi:hypothetical protein
LKRSSHFVTRIGFAQQISSTFPTRDSHQSYSSNCCFDYGNGTVEAVRDREQDGRQPAEQRRRSARGRGATAIAAPASAGRYKLFVLDDQGNRRGESAAILRVK